MNAKDYKNAMEDPSRKAKSLPQSEKTRRKTERKGTRDDAGVSAEGGFMLSTSEILDFAEGTDSTP